MKSRRIPINALIYDALTCIHVIFSAFNVRSSSTYIISS